MPTETPLPTQIPFGAIGSRVRINSPSGAVRAYEVLVNCQPKHKYPNVGPEYDSVLVNDRDGAVVVGVASGCSPRWWRLQFEKPIILRYRTYNPFELDLWVPSAYVAPR
jgi:hypothetical protein